MEKQEELLNKAINLLKTVVKYNVDWHLYTDADNALLRQEIELFLKQFKEKPKPKNRYRQIDIEESIDEIIGIKNKLQ
jgi:hypothetical protein